MKRILVIKLGALGDFAQAFGVMELIRKAHADAEITLLTTPPYQELLRASGLVDRIDTDGRPKGVLGYLRLITRLRRARFQRVYDLHTSARTSNYRLFFWPKFPEWSGISPGATHRQTRPDREAMHNLDRLYDQLHVAGIAPAYPIGEAPAPDLGWAVEAAKQGRATVAERFGLRPPFALLAPGASATGEAKKWPIERYAELARRLAEAGYHVGVVGGRVEAPLADRIRQAVPDAADLTGRTAMVDLAGLGAEAALFVGNDTGPTHMAAYAGAPGLMLMAHVSRPGHCEPRARMDVVMVPDLQDLAVDTVLQRLKRSYVWTGPEKTLLD